jgi:nitroreductase/dihydropteridine reductase
MNIADLVQTRYTTKAFDPSRQLSADQVAQIETLLRFSPSSTNSQPWHFFIAGSAEGKARVAKATSAAYAFNEAKVLNASHVVVFCSRASIDDSHLQGCWNRKRQMGALPMKKHVPASIVAARTSSTCIVLNCATRITGWKSRFTWR